MRFSMRIQCATLHDSSNKEIPKFLDKDGFSGLLMTDISKAFYCTDHKLILAKLRGGQMSF